MPVCPKCGRQINKLYYVIYVREVAPVHVDGENLTYRIYSEFVDAWFCCVKCRGKLFKDEKDAEKFLRGDLKMLLKTLGEAVNECLW